MNPRLLPTTGGVIKKITEINPDLRVEEVIALVRQSLCKQGGGAYNEFANIDIIDEEKALRLARETVAAK